MDFIFIILGMSTMLLFLFKRDWLMNKNASILLLVWNIFLFCGGYSLQFYRIGNPEIVIALKISLLCQIIFFVLVFSFRKLYGKNPEDTFWTMDISLLKDGIFNFLFWVIAGFVSAVLVFTKII